MGIREWFGRGAANSGTETPSFEVGEGLFHPAHGTLRLLQITRRAPRMLWETSRGPGVPVAFVAENETVVDVNLASGEVRLVPARMHEGKEDVLVLETSKDANRMMVRASQAEAWGLRRVGSPELAERMLDVLRQDVAADGESAWETRYASYMSRMRDPAQSAAVLRDLCRVSGRRDLTLGEQRLIGVVRQRVVQEIAAAKGATEETVDPEVGHLCEAARDRGALDA